MLRLSKHFDNSLMGKWIKFILVHRYIMMKYKGSAILLQYMNIWRSYGPFCANGVILITVVIVLVISVLLIEKAMKSNFDVAGIRTTNLRVCQLSGL